jgi:hypothetical protein
VGVSCPTETTKKKSSGVVRPQHKPGAARAASPEGLGRDGGPRVRSKRVAVGILRRVIENFEHPLTEADAPALVGYRRHRSASTRWRPVHISRGSGSTA